MTKIIFVHGMGDQKSSDFDGFRDAIWNEANARGKTFDKINDWRLCYWADVTQGEENDLYGLIARPSVLLHRRLFSSESDVIAYSTRPPYSTLPGNRYAAIQQRFTDSVDWCSNHSPPPPQQTPLIVIGHSLGSIIAADGLWYLFQAAAAQTNLVLSSVITFGSPLALFSLQLPNFNYFLPAPAQWFNYYYAADVIAFPLKFTSPNYTSPYDNAVTEDKRLCPWDMSLSLRKLSRVAIACIPVLGILSHDWYYDDRRVIVKIVSCMS